MSCISNGYVSDGTTDYLVCFHLTDIFLYTTHGATSGAIDPLTRHAYPPKDIVISTYSELPCTELVPSDRSHFDRCTDNRGQTDLRYSCWEQVLQIPTKVSLIRSGRKPTAPRSLHQYFNYSLVVRAKAFEPASRWNVTAEKKSASRLLS